MLNDEQVDSLCDEFENAWISSTPPDLVAFIQRYEDDATMRQVIEALVPLDLEYRRKTGALQSLIDVGLQEAEVAKLGDPSLIDFFRQTMASTSKSLSKLKFIGPYKLLQLLGKGGMGEVWMAEQERPVRRRVALKLIKTGIDSQAVVARFEAERQAIALMDHPNIAKFLDAGTTEDGQPYFAMELVKGISLTQFCDEQKLTVEHRLELLLPVCHAVQHAHQKGIIHRDLKPSNVLVALYDGKPVPKVIDFGLAKALQNERKLTEKTLFTEFGQVLGTVQYMAPEQAELNQLDVDTRVDIYSLGIILYELLTGSTPIEPESFQNQALLQVLEMIREKEPPLPSVRLSSATQKAALGSSVQRQIELSNLKSLLQDELDWIVMKAIDKNRARRYETVSKLAEDLMRFLNNEVVTARPPSRSYLLSKFLTKHRRLVLTSASLLTLLTLGLFGTGIMWYRATLSESESKNLAVLEREAANEARFQKNEAVRLLEEKHFLNKKASKWLFEYGLDNYDACDFESGVEKLVTAWEMRGDDDPLKNAYARVITDRLSRKPKTLQHNNRVRVIAFSPDGTKVATAVGLGAVVWDVMSGEKVCDLKSLDNIVQCIAFSPDGTHIATGDDRYARIWDAKTGRPLFKSMWHETNLNQVAFSPDGTFLASARTDGVVRVWDVKSGEPLDELHSNGNWKQHLHSFDEDILSIRYSAEGLRVVSASIDGKVRIWSAKSGEWIDLPIQLDDHALSVALSQDEKLVATVSIDHTCRIWDASTGEPISDSGRYIGRIDCIAFCFDSTYIAIAYYDGSILVWDTNNWTQVGEPIRHKGRVNSIVCSPTGDFLATASDDETAKIWKMPNDTQPKALLQHDYQVGAVSFSNDGTHIASASHKTVQIWNAESRIAVGPPMIHDHNIWSIAYSPDGKRLATSSGSTVRIWDPKIGICIGDIICDDLSIRGLTISPNGARMAVISDGGLRIYDAKTLKPITDQMVHDKIFTAAFSPDSARLATGSLDKTVQIWDAVSGSLLGVPKQLDDAVWSIAYSPDGTRLATATGNIVNIWNSKTGTLMGQPMRHSGIVNSITFSPDGVVMATASDDRTVRIWDVQTGASLGEPMWHNGGVNSIAFKPDGTLLAAASDDLVSLWRIGIFSTRFSLGQEQN